jgi:hypothetical protein
MKRVAIPFICGGILTLGAVLLVHARENAPQSPASADKPPVYVYDFELDVAPPGSANQASSAAQDAPSANAPNPPPGTSPQQSGAAPVNPEQEKRKHASELVNWMSSSLVAELQKAGYGVNRLHAGDARPATGVAIRGIFAEIDPENHWRRAVIRGADDSGKMQALVTVVNLAKPEQALYEIAHLPGNGARPGAVITLSPYVPLTKYELDKQTDQPAFQAIASRMVKDFTALLVANPAALTQ